MRKQKSIFSGVVRKFGWFDYPKFVSFFKFLPFVIALIIIIILFIFCDFQRLNRIMAEFEKSGEHLLLFNIIILTGNAVLIVIVSSLYYFYRENLLKFENLDKIKEEIPRVINAINQGTENQALKGDFTQNSFEDLQFLRGLNNAITRFSSNAHLLSAGLIFISSAWAVFDEPMCLLSLWSDCWERYRLSIGISLIFLTFSNIFLHGIMFLIIIHIKYLIGKSLSRENIEKQFREYRDDYEKVKQAFTLEGLDKIKDNFGLDN